MKHISNSQPLKAAEGNALRRWRRVLRRPPPCCTEAGKRLRAGDPPARGEGTHAKEKRIRKRRVRAKSSMKRAMYSTCTHAISKS